MFCDRSWTMAASLMALAVAIAAGGCSPSSDRAEGRPLIVQVRPFEVLGQGEGADYVGRAFAESIAGTLADSNDLQLLEVASEGESAATDGATRLITGTLTRTGESNRAELKLFDPVRNELLWQAEISSDAADLSELAVQLAMGTIRSMEVSCPDPYRYVGNLTGGPELADSPLMTQAIGFLQRGDNESLLQVSSDLIARFGEDPAAQAIDGWALMIAWAAVPLSETHLTKLRERLVELDRVDPESPYDEVMLGYVYRSSGQPEQARALYSGVLARDDLSNVARAWVLRQRSFTFLQAGNAAAARDDASEAVRLDPSHASSHVALSKALEAAGDLDGAVLHSRQALLLQPSSWRQHQRLGLVLMRGGKFQEAILPMDRACRLSESQEACANLAVVLQRAERAAEAFQAGGHAASLAASRWGLYNLACYQARAGRKAAALDSLQRAVDLGYADNLMTTDPDLDFLRDDPAFDGILSAVRNRLRTRQLLSSTVFPWQS